MRSRPYLAALTAGVLAFGVAACGDDDEEPAAGGSTAAETTAEAPAEDLSGLTGSIRSDGSSTVQPIAEAASEAFGEQASGVQITVGGVGTGDGFERFCRGELDLAQASRRIEAEELEACGTETPPVEVQVGIDGLSVIANPGVEIPNDCITTDQLKELLLPDSKVSNLSELGEGFPDQDVSFFTPGTESGTYDYFTEAVLETDAEQRTEGVQTSADDNQIITGIAGTEGAIGYVGYAFAQENADKVTTLQVDGGDGCVEPTVETIADGSYAPLSRPLFFYPSVETVARPEVKAFLKFILDNNQQLTEVSGYIPITEEIKAASQMALDSPTALTAADLEQ